MIITVVEPHADDAYLSLHDHIRHWVKGGVEVRVITVFADRKRAPEGREYAALLGAAHEWSGIEGQVHLGETETNIGPLIRQVMDHVLPKLRKDSPVILPLGIQHPEHLATRNALDAGARAYYYMEIPYAQKRKNQESVAALVAGLPLFSLRYPDATKAQAKFWGIFRTQAKFFHFNPMADLRRFPEIILKPKGA